MQLSSALASPPGSSLETPGVQTAPLPPAERESASWSVSAANSERDCHVPLDEGAVFRDFWVFDLPNSVTLLAVNDAALTSAPGPPGQCCCCRCGCFGRILRFPKTRFCMQAAAFASKCAPPDAQSSSASGASQWRSAAETCRCDSCVSFLRSGGVARPVVSEHCVPSAARFVALKNSLSQRQRLYASQQRLQRHNAEALRFSTGGNDAPPSVESERRFASSDARTALEEGTGTEEGSAASEGRSEAQRSRVSRAVGSQCLGGSGTCVCFDSFPAAALLGSIRLLCGFYLILAERRAVAGLLPRRVVGDRKEELVFGVSSVRLVPLFAFDFGRTRRGDSLRAQKSPVALLHASSVLDAVVEMELRLQAKRIAGGGACCTPSVSAVDADELQVGVGLVSARTRSSSLLLSAPLALVETEVSFEDQPSVLRAVRLLLERERRHLAMLQLSMQSGNPRGLLFSYGTDVTLSQQHQLSIQLQRLKNEKEGSLQETQRRSPHQQCEVCGCLHGKPLFGRNGHFVFNKFVLKQLLRARLGEEEAESSTDEDGERVASSCECCVCASFSFRAGICCLRSWLVVLTQGALQQRLLQFLPQPQPQLQEDRLFLLSVMARRSRFALGTRFFRRGLERRPCATGACKSRSSCFCGFLGVANEVESEQVLWRVEAKPEDENENISRLHFGACAASVIHRGSIPIFWRHCSSHRNLLLQLLQPSPQTVIDLPADAVYVHAKQHLRWLLQRYGSPLLVLDLVQQTHKTEGRLSAEFQKVVQLCAEEACKSNGFSSSPKGNQKDAGSTRQFPVSYAAFDFHAKTNSLGFDAALAELAGVMAAGLRRHNFFALRDPSTLPFDATEEEKAGLSLQHGIMRVNCIDCLDRTNIAHTAFGVVAFYAHLKALGWRQPPPHFCFAWNSLDSHSLLRLSLLNDAKRRSHRSRLLFAAEEAVLADSNRRPQQSLGDEKDKHEREKDQGRSLEEEVKSVVQSVFEEPDLAPRTLLVEEVASVWRIVGDFVSLQYAGSAALHAAEFASSEANGKNNLGPASALASLTSRGRASDADFAKDAASERVASHAWRVAVEGMEQENAEGLSGGRPWRARPRKSAMFAVQRFVSNKIYDEDRQRAIELLQGRLTPAPGGSDIFAAPAAAIPLPSEEERDGKEEEEEQKAHATPLPSDVRIATTTTMQRRKEDDISSCGDTPAEDSCPEKKGKDAASLKARHLARLKNFL